MTCFASSTFALGRSLAFAVGLSSIGGCATTGLMAPTDQPGLTVIPPAPDLSGTLESAIARDYHVSGVSVSVESTSHADFNANGREDTAGTALLRHGNFFKSFVFLMTDDGAVRFLEANGGRFDPIAGGAPLTCDSKPVACPATFERARRQIRPASFRLADFDPTQTGLELAFAYDDGSQGILNAARLFHSE